MEEELIKLPFYLGSEISKILNIKKNTNSVRFNLKK